MTAKPSTTSALLSGCLLVITLGGWWWRLAGPGRRANGPALVHESWQQVTSVYPMPEPPPGAGARPAPAFDAVVEANPFSPTRKYVAPPTAGDGQSGTEQPGPAPKSQFVYKGRINLGNRQRAIVEDVTTKKTHFLEVGQEVAGLKVLDITETQVLLSDARTREEIVLLLTAPGKP